MNAINIPYISEYENVLNQKFKELKKDYSIAKKRANDVFRDNINDSLFSHKLNHEIDVSVLEMDVSMCFKKYEIDIEDRITRSLNHKYLLDQETLISIFNIRKEMMEFNISELNIDNLGTVLNDLREFMEDIEVDIERNKIIKKYTAHSADSNKGNSTYTERYYVDSFKKYQGSAGLIKNEEKDWKVIYD